MAAKGWIYPCIGVTSSNTRRGFLTNPTKPLSVSLIRDSDVMWMLLILLSCRSVDYSSSIYLARPFLFDSPSPFSLTLYNSRNGILLCLNSPRCSFPFLVQSFNLYFLAEMFVVYKEFLQICCYPNDFISEISSPVQSSYSVSNWLCQLRQSSLFNSYIKRRVSNKPTYHNYPTVYGAVNYILK
jgi:hypothetical protein